MRNLLKLIVVGIVSMSSWHCASGAINEMVIAVEAREKTLADLIIKKQVEEAFKVVEEKIEAVVEEEEIIIETEKVDMKPSLPPPKKEKPVIAQMKEESEDLQEDILQSTSPSEEIEVVDVEEEPQEAYILTEEDVRYIGEYLVDHYFLNGYEYRDQVEDPALTERKYLAHEMELEVIESLEDALKLMQSFNKLTDATVVEILQSVRARRENFIISYEQIARGYEGFNVVYDAITGYFNTYCETIDTLHQMLVSMKETTNPALVLPMMMKSLNQDILPGITAILEKGVSLKAHTNAIYLEGIEGVQLISQQEVIAIIDEPKHILPQFQQILD